MRFSILSSHKGCNFVPLIELALIIISKNTYCGYTDIDTYSVGHELGYVINQVVSHASFTLQRLGQDRNFFSSSSFNSIDKHVQVKSLAGAA